MCTVIIKVDKISYTREFSYDKYKQIIKHKD